MDIETRVANIEENIGKILGVLGRLDSNHGNLYDAYAKEQGYASAEEQQAIEMLENEGTEFVEEQPKKFEVCVV